MASSCGDQSLFFTALSKWFSHRSRHCLPARPGIAAAITDHFFAPICATSSRRSWSSSGSHGPFTTFSFTTCQRRSHAKGDRWTWAGSMCLDTPRQSLRPYLRTASRSTASSSSPQGSVENCPIPSSSSSAAAPVCPPLSTVIGKATAVGASLGVGSFKDKFRLPPRLPRLPPRLANRSAPSSTRESGRPSSAAKTSMPSCPFGVTHVPRVGCRLDCGRIASKDSEREDRTSASLLSRVVFRFRRVFISHKF
mmetsp:Transcript_31442/g.63871  ORF Transcript_31442/g.63871 Transcript_31442/m.63871 type:complete len:252 (+) Transcript_31442:1267-2022(+)